MQNRIAALRERLAAANLDAAIITHPSNRFYLTGFTAEDHPPNESPGHVVVGHDRVVLVTSPLERSRAREQAPTIDVFDEIRPLAKGDAAVLRALGARRIGFEDEAILYRDYTTLQTALGDGAEFYPLGTTVDDLRAVKTEDEIKIIARAIEITDQAFERVAPTIKAGETERTIAWRIDSAMRELGADGPAFPTIVASGPNAALPHHEPSDRTIGVGESIVIDMGAALKGYCADLTRTVWVGEPDETLRAIYPIVLQAVQAVEQTLRAGMTGKEADAIARDVISAAGYGDAFVHSLGHGVGVRVHEAPTLSVRSDVPLVAGNVTTIEPGIYLPGRGGVRIEDVAVIEADGIRVLTQAAKKNID